MNLLDAVHAGVVSVKAEGIGDGRMSLSVTNRSKRQLRVVLPPGIIAQAPPASLVAWVAWAAAWAAWAAAWAVAWAAWGWHGRWHGRWHVAAWVAAWAVAWVAWVVWAAHRDDAVNDGNDDAVRMIMYFCGDPDSWDMRSLMIGMMGGMGGGMGGMGGGMMGGMGGGMGGMGGGMRSVPPSALPSAVLNAGQTRHLPTRLVSITAPNAQSGRGPARKGREAEDLGDVTNVNDDPQVQKALRRLTAEMAPTSVSQLVMWRLAAKLDWETIALLSEKWANDYELMLARDFVDHLDVLPEGETGRLLIEVTGKDAAGEPIAVELGKLLGGKTVLGLLAQVERFRRGRVVLRWRVGCG